MGSRVAAWMCAWAALSVVGCGKSVGGAEPIPQAELPKRVANLLCDSLAGCCKSSGFPVDLAACKAAYTAELRDDLTDDDQRRVHYDAQAAGDCLAAVASNIQCGEVDDDDAPACERIFVGSVALGQPCDGSRECAPVAGRSVYCESDDGVSPAVCTASSAITPPHGKAGDACSITCFESDSCAVGDAPVPLPGPGGVPEPQTDPVACYRTDGVFCDAGRYAPLVAVGEVCDGYEACRGTAFCNFNTRLCTAPQPNGSPCESNDNCQSAHCGGEVGGNVADPASGAPQVCISATAVSLGRCESASSMNPPPDSTEPGDDTTDPGTGAGTP